MEGCGRYACDDERMSEHFDINATLTITCSRCGKTAGGWDETWKQGWNEITDLDTDGDEVATDAQRLYEVFCSALRNLGVKVETGSFGARMRVELLNDGPVTIVLDG